MIYTTLSKLSLTYGRADVSDLLCKQIIPRVSCLAFLDLILSEKRFGIVVNLDLLYTGHQL